jgi:hypothetical protein
MSRASALRVSRRIDPSIWRMEESTRPCMLCASFAKLPKRRLRRSRRCVWAEVPMLSSALAVPLSASVVRRPSSLIARSVPLAPSSSSYRLVAVAMGTR